MSSFSLFAIVFISTVVILLEKNLFESLLKFTPDRVYFKDRKSKFLRVSQTMVKDFNQEVEEDLIGKSDYDFFGAHAREAYADEQRIIKTGNPMLNVVEEDMVGSTRKKYVTTSKMPLLGSEGDIIGTFGVSRDITEIREAEMSLKEMENKIKSKNQK